jgi:hypothetical protein
MQKQLRIITRQRLAVCPFSISFFPAPALPSFVFSRHLGRRPVYYRYRRSRVFTIPGGWWLHCSPSGRRWLSALPF